MLSTVCGLVDVGPGTRAADAGRGDQDVHRAERLDAAPDHRVVRGLVGGVHLRPRARAARRLDLPRGLRRPRFRSRSATQTFAPSSANRTAQARPMPLPPPVISATFPSSRPGI